MAATHDLQAAKLFSLKGYVCLVTGGGTGIGLMITQGLAANGAKVYITGRRTEVLEKSAKEHEPEGGQIIPTDSHDMTDKASLDSLVKSLESKEKYLSLFVAAAGVSGPKASPDTSDAKQMQKNLWQESPEDWASTYNTNVTAVYFSTVAVLPLLQAAPKEHNASVIVISSMSGMMRNAQGHFAYNAAKGATAHLSKMMSKEFGGTGVRVNSIAPGYFPSEMTMKESDERNKVDMPDEKVKDKGHEVPAGRSGTDEEMAMLAIFLTKCGYVNGQIIAIDGGVLNEVGG